MTTPLRIALVPDEFKGSLDTRAVAEALERGALAACQAAGIDPANIETERIAFADGGEGSLDVLTEQLGLDTVEVDATDALGRSTKAKFGIGENAGRKIAVVEVAQANGIVQVSDAPQQPLAADSAGVGDILRAALDHGAQDITLLLGGTATTDGGAGILRALGAKLLDEAGEPIGPGGGDLHRLDSIDTTNLDPRLASVTWNIAVDVRNPLVGKTGAAAVFGPQKGATSADIETLDNGLQRFAEVLAPEDAADLVQTPGLGAAGGLSLPLVALFGAQLQEAGIMLAKLIDLPGKLAGADLIITGEGRFDGQSLHGKVVDVVSTFAPKTATVLVVAGQVDVDYSQMRAAGIHGAFSISPGAMSLDKLIESADKYIADTAAQATGTWLVGRQC